MATELFDWLDRIKDVEREHSAVRFAVDRLKNDSSRAPNVLSAELAFQTVRMAWERLDGTYVIRLFGEFENGLRSFWSTSRSTNPPSRTRDLLDGIAASRRIPYDQHQNAHEVREYRNMLVHRRVLTPEQQPISMSTARSYLCRFFSYLPPDW